MSNLRRIRGSGLLTVSLVDIINLNKRGAYTHVNGRGFRYERQVPGGVMAITGTIILLLALRVWDIYFLQRQQNGG